VKTVETESEILVKAVEKEVLIAFKRFAKVVDASSPVSVYMRCDRNKMDCMPGTVQRYRVAGHIPYLEGTSVGWPHGRGVNSLCPQPNTEFSPVN